MSRMACYLTEAALLCAAGSGSQTRAQLCSQAETLTLTDQFSPGRVLPVGLYRGELPVIPLVGFQWQSRNNQLALAALQQIQPAVEAAIERYGRHRVGVIVGTSTSGIAESEAPIAQWTQQGCVPDDYHYARQEMAAPAQFLAEVLDVAGPAYSVSTACSSGAKALASARRLIQAGLCDAVIAGGVDSLCQLTVQGFSALEAISETVCQPFGAERDGINIGEGAALFLVSAEPRGVLLAGVGEGSDAHHISAPDPAGAGAVRVMQAALSDAGITAAEVGYLNLHGTATPLNDQMEARAVNQLFGDQVACSSTKSYTGHTLGAAGALEAAFCWQLLQAKEAAPALPAQRLAGPYDSTLASLNLVQPGTSASQPLRYVLSNSFAFGGSNISLILGRIE